MPTGSAARLWSCLLSSACLAGVAQAQTAVELVDAAAFFNGSRVLVDGVASSNHAFELFSRVPQSEWSCERTQVCDIVLELAEPYDLQFLAIKPASDPAVRPSAVDIATAPAAAGPWTTLAEVKPGTTAELQRFPISAPQVRYARIRMTGWTSGDYAGMDDVQLLGRPSQQRSVDWKGSWLNSSNTALSLQQDGSRIAGCFEHNNGIVGEADGAVLTGTFELTGEEGGSVERAPFVWVMTPEGNLRGVWGSQSTPGILTERMDSERLEDGAGPACVDPADGASSGLAAELDAKGRVVLHGVQFDYDKDTLKAGSDKALQPLAKAILAHPERSYTIEGHTDDRGSQTYNQDLSERWAGSVKAWLVGQGCPADKLGTQGFGAGSPIAPNDTAAGRAMNRRVEVAVEG